MTAVIRGRDPDQKPRKSAGYWGGFSGTGAELGGLGDGYGLCVEGQDVLLGEAGEGAGEGLARDAGGLGHLLAGERGLEDDAPLRDAAFFGGEVQEHAGHPLGGAAEDEVADEVFELAGAGGEDPVQADGPLREAAHHVEEVVAEDGVEHAVGERRGALALRAAFEGGAEAQYRAVADDAEDLVARLRPGGRAVELRPPLAHEVHGPGGLALPVERRPGPELEHLGRDRERLEEPLFEPLQKLELLEPLELGQVLHRPAPRPRQPRPGRRRVLTVHPRASSLNICASRYLYTLRGEGLQYDKPSASSAT